MDTLYCCWFCCSVFFFFFSLTTQQTKKLSLSLFFFGFFMSNVCWVAICCPQQQQQSIHIYTFLFSLVFLLCGSPLFCGYFFYIVYILYIYMIPRSRPRQRLKFKLCHHLDSNISQKLIFPKNSRKAIGYDTQKKQTNSHDTTTMTTMTKKNTLSFRHAAAHFFGQNEYGILQPG